jgi:hypothetical protein
MGTHALLRGEVPVDPRFGVIEASMPPALRLGIHPPLLAL